MKKYKYIRSVILGSLFFLSLVFACITDYQPKGIEELRDILVVEGTINEGETIIKISRSVGLLGDLTKNAYISNAIVYVERNDGVISESGVYTEQGQYVIQVGAFDREKQYRLRIQVDGLEYASEYLTPILTPEIEKLELTKQDTGHPVYVCVDTSDPSNQSRYYRWSYQENWEVWAPLEANAGKEWIDGREVVIEYDLTTSDNITYCWGSGKSTTLLLGSTEKLSENSIIGQRLTSMDPSSYRLSVLYYVKVEQTQIRKEAYDYFYNLQKNVEQGAGIFGGMPMEMKGNIKCLTNPDIDVIGYIEVATITEKDRYVYSNEGFYEPARVNCQSTTSGTEAEEMGYILYFIDPGSGEWNYAYRDCVDCRTRGGSKVKPDFWPTNRQ